MNEQKNIGLDEAETTKNDVINAEPKLYTADDKLTTLISDNPLLLMAMSRFGISLGFGEKTVGRICEEQDVDAPTFLAVANFITFGTINIEGVDLRSLIDYLNHAHSYFLDFNLPLIRRKLIEAIDCSGRDEVAMLILKFYDDYTLEVHRHMKHENDTVFVYVGRLLEGRADSSYNIDIFASGHHSIHSKLKELKDIIIRYYPQRENNLLNAVLFDIINCEQDLTTHCRVEDNIFVPVVKRLEKEIAMAPGQEASAEEETEGINTDSGSLSNREREIIACVAKGLSNKEIADRLCISVNTVTTHRRNLVQKLGIHSAAGLAIYAVINKIIDLNEITLTK